MIVRVKNRLTREWLKLQYSALAGKKIFNPENALIISGDPRGGTTWLSELIHQLPETTLLWEPLAIKEVKEFKDLQFQWRQYIPQHEKWPEAKSVFTDLFSGKILSPYLCKHTSPAEFKSSKLLVLKFCRANQLLPWLTHEFHFTYAPVYLVRHPCAVVASQLKQGGWSHVSQKFIVPEGRFDSFYKDHLDFLKSINTVEKRLAAYWCLCNGVPLQHPENNVRWITITYESMLLEFESQLNRIEDRWHLKFPESVFENPQKASSTTLKESPIQDARTLNQLSYWKKELSSKQIENILEVVNYFQIPLYNSSEFPQLVYQD